MRSRFIRAGVALVGVSLALIPGAAAATRGPAPDAAPNAATASATAKGSPTTWLAAPLGKAAKPSVTVNGNPQDIASGQFNGDTYLDVAVASTTTKQVAVLFGDGDGSLQDPVYYTVANNPLRIATGDFNGDGKADLAVTEPDGVQLLMNNGSGVFTVGTEVTVASPNLHGIAVGDFDGDTKADVIALAANEVEFFKGDGAGGLAAGAAWAVSTGLHQANDLAGGNFKKADAQLEIAVVGSDVAGAGKLVILTGAAATTISAGSYPLDHVMAIESTTPDDGNLDVVATQGDAANQVNTALWSFTGDGLGGMAAGTHSATAGVPNGLGQADVDRDGKIDVVMADPATTTSAGNVAAAYGNGDGTFKDAAAIIADPATAVAPGDFNGDTWSDFATTSLAPDQVRLYVAMHDRYFTWYDKASPGMWNDNIHITNPNAVRAWGTVTVGSASAYFTADAGKTTFVTLPAGTIGGPVKVMSSLPVVSTQRVQYNQTFNEVQSQGELDGKTLQYFTWFDKASPGMWNDNIHLVNPSSSATSGTVTLGATSKTFTLDPGKATYVTFDTGTIGGPVKVAVDGGKPGVLASQRVQYYGTFNEVLGTDGAGAAAFYFPWYDKASPGMWNDNIHVINPTASTVTGKITLSGQTAISFSLDAGKEAYYSFPAGAIGGPVAVKADASGMVIASERVQFNQSFDEVLGAPAPGQTTSYFNWFDKASPGMWNVNIHLVNTNGATVTGKISMPGQTDISFSVPAGGQAYYTFPAGTIGGPVKVAADGGANVIASLRTQYYQTFNEVPAAIAG